MKNFLLFLTCLLTLAATAQKVNYKILSDDPRNVKSFSLALEPAYLDLYASDFHLGYSIRAELLLLKRLELRADFRRAYFDMNQKEAENNPWLPKNGVKQASAFEAGFSLFFFDKLTKTQTKLVLSSRTSGNYTYTKYIMIPATARKMFGVGGGLYNNRVALNIEKDKQVNFDIAKGNGDTAVSGDDIFTMFNASVLYGGLHWKKIIDVIADTDYGMRKVGGMTDFYIDFLFAPVLHFSDVKDPNGEIYEVKAASDHLKRMGWRLGWTYRHPNKVGFTYKMEFGSRPGYQTKKGISLDNEKAFFLFTLGFNIPAGKKKDLQK